MKNKITELIMKLDYVNEGDIEKLISIMKNTNLKLNKIGIDEYSITINE